MSKLLEDPKVAALVERETKKAVNADRRRILEGARELKLGTDSPVDAGVRKAVNQTVADVNKLVRGAA